MSKKFDFDVTQFSTDDIGEMSNDELQRHIMRVRRSIKEARKMGYATLSHEVEYCYLDHERQMRHRREQSFKKGRR
jgi:hypothetical protein